MRVDLAERVERIAKDDRHGASWLAKEALETVCEAVRLGEDPLELGRALVRARPAIGAIAGAVGRVLAAGRSEEQILDEARALLASRERASTSIAVLLRDDLSERIVMTHSASATAREALIHAQPRRVVCTESEPVGEGRDFVEELRAAGLTTELVADPDAAHAVTSVELLLLGADTVFRDGSLVNKIGTRDLSRAARDADVPVVVACEVLKLAPVEAHEPDEERFDLTPPDQIDRFVTEEGEFAPEDIATLVDRTPFLREGYELVRDRARSGSSKL